MICEKTNGSGFRGLTEYLLRGNRGDIIAGVMAGRTPRELAYEFGMLRRLNPAMKKAVMHFSISPAPEDPPFTDELWQHIAQCFVHALGYQDAPWAAVMHREDPKHVHMHVVACRIDLKGRTVSNFNDFRKAEKLMRKLESELGLRAVPGVHSPKAKPSNNQPQGDTMNNEQPHDPSLDFASGPQQFNPGTNNAALALALTNPGIRVNGASTDVLPKVGREMRRRNIESDYETRMRQVLGDSLTRIYTHNDGVLLHFRDKGQIQDLGSRVIAQGGMEERLAAERIVAMGLERKWPNITFTGSPVFIEHAMRAALKARLKVVAKGDDQADILAKVMAEQRGGMGAMAGAAAQPLPPGAVVMDDHVQQILSELDGLPPPQKLGAPPQPVAPKPTAPTPLLQAPAPVGPATAPVKPVVGVFPPHINFKERLQARREQRSQGNPPGTGPKVSRPAPPRP